MRRNLFLTIAFALLAATSWGQEHTPANEAEARQMVSDVEPLNLRRCAPKEALKMLVPQTRKAQKNSIQPLVRKGLQRADETVDTVEYFAVARSFHHSYTFDPNNGDVKTYKIGVAIDGTKVTFKNLFNLYDSTAYSPTTEYPVSGTYDATAHTITIPTSTVFSEATVVAGFYEGYYPGVLTSGTVDLATGKMSPTDNLVFHVEGDFKRIYTDQDFGVAMYSPDGSSSYGLSSGSDYNSFSAYAASSSALLMTPQSDVEFGNTYPGQPMERTLTLVNAGGSSTDYVVSVDADPEGAFTATPISGTIAAQSTAQVNLSFNHSTIGPAEGLVTVESEDGDPLTVTLAGTIISQPDFSAIVKKGDIKMETNIDYPFALDTLASGQVVAASGCNGRGNASSKLTATVTVPDGMSGLLTWKGTSHNSGAATGRNYYAASGMFFDDMNTAARVYNNLDDDVSGSVELTPGTHQIRFQYDQYYYTGNEADRMCLYDLELTNTQLPADSASVTTKSLDMGNFVLEKGGTVTHEADIIIQNRGKNNLTVNSVSSDNSEFRPDNNASPATSLMNVSIPVTLSATTAGTKTANITVNTSAGTFVVPVKAQVIDMPDFSSIVDEGAEYMTFTTDNNYPFVVDNGIAYNYNCDKDTIDSVQIKSSFTVSFTIPEGKLGYMSWEGRADAVSQADYPNDYWMHDYAVVDVSHPMTSGAKPGWGQQDVGSEALFGSDDAWKDYLACVPGKHSFEFAYQQMGDKMYTGKNRAEYSHLRLHVIDFKEHNVELEGSKEVSFDSTYVGPQRYTTATVTLHNTGSADLTVDSISASNNGNGPFYGVVPSDRAAFNKSLDVTLWFYPGQEGNYNDSVTIYTNGGNVTVNCHGKTKSAKGLLLIGDFEDAAYGWTTYDGNNDGETWNLGSNLWGETPNYVHSGKDCLASISYSNNLGSITPDNWTFSPVVAVPEEGATLTYYVSAFSPTRYAEHYALYINENVSDVTALAATTPAYEETIDVAPTEDETGYVNGWQKRTIDLTPYAGKDVYLAFRHYDCTGQYILRLDDVFAFEKGTADPTGISYLKTDENNKVARNEYYNLSGERLNAPIQGVNIVRSTYPDGTVRTHKVLLK
jgi:hypothetical protein